MDVSLLINPWVVSTALGLVLGVALIFALVRSTHVWSGWLKAMRDKVFTRTGFFWIVNITFMAVSILHGGVFFGLTGQSNQAHNVPGTQFLGFAVIFFLDLVTIILMQAMLEARHRGEDRRAVQFLFFIIVSCATSTFANLAIDLNDFNPTLALPHAPWWVQDASPYVLASFPLFIIMTSIAAELIINIRPMDKLDEETFENDEKKRIRMLEIRNQYLAKQVAAELEMHAIRAKQRVNKALHKGKLPHGFRWPWEKPIEADVLIAGVSQQLEMTYVSKIEALISEVNALKSAVNDGIRDQVTIENTPLQTVIDADIHNNENIEVTPLQTVNDADIRDQATIKDAPLPEGHWASGLLKVAPTDRPDKVAPTEPITEQLEVISSDLSPDVVEVVQHYPLVYTRWLSQGIKSVTIDEIVEVTKQPKRRVQYQLGRTLKLASRSKNKILVSTVLKWLKVAPQPEPQTLDLVTVG